VLLPAQAVVNLKPGLRREPRTLGGGWRGFLAISSAGRARGEAAAQRRQRPQWIGHH
jgi:hypothetical protein